MGVDAKWVDESQERYHKDRKKETGQQRNMRKNGEKRYNKRKRGRYRRNSSRSEFLPKDRMLMMIGQRQERGYTHL